MSEEQLRKLIDYASQFAEKAMQQHGSVSPIWHMITRDGKQIVELTPSLDKSEAMLLIRTLMELQDVVRYVHFGEAWMVDLRGRSGPVDGEEELAKMIASGGPSQHRDRIETVMFQAEDNEAGMMRGHRRIIRDTAKPYLGPLEVLPLTGISEGRMAGMLPKPKGKSQ